MGLTMAKCLASDFCAYNPLSNGYCFMHQNMANSAIDVKKKTVIPKQSEQRIKDNRELKKRYTLFLDKWENKFCKLKMDDECAQVASVVHHTAGREGEQLFNEEDWMPACPHCNLMVEIKDAEARAKGLKKSKHQVRHEQIEE